MKSMFDEKIVRTEIYIEVTLDRIVVNLASGASSYLFSVDLTKPTYIPDMIATFKIYVNENQLHNLTITLNSNFSPTASIDNYMKIPLSDTHAAIERFILAHLPEQIRRMEETKFQKQTCTII